VEEVGYEEEGRGRGQIPTIDWVFDEDECPMPDGKNKLCVSVFRGCATDHLTYLKKNELVEPYSRSVVAEDNQNQNNQAANVVPLRPCFKKSSFYTETFSCRW
jgi:hypothetical protein